MMTESRIIGLHPLANDRLHDNLALTVDGLIRTAGSKLASGISNSSDRYSIYTSTSFIIVIYLIMSHCTVYGTCNTFFLPMSITI